MPSSRCRPAHGQADPEQPDRDHDRGPDHPTTAPTAPKTAKISKVTVKGPAKAKKGKKATYTVKITNSGDAEATGVELEVRGKGVKAKKSVGTIAAGQTKTVKVRLKFKKAGKVKLSFEVTSSNAGGMSLMKRRSGSRSRPVRLPRCFRASHGKPSDTRRTFSSRRLASMALRPGFRPNRSARRRSLLSEMSYRETESRKVGDGAEGFWTGWRCRARRDAGPVAARCYGPRCCER